MFEYVLNGKYMGALKRRKFLVPNRHRDGKSRSSAHRISRNRRGTGAVAQVINVDAPDAIFWAADSRKTLRDRFRDVIRDGLAKSFYDCPIVLGCQRYHDVKAFAAAGFRETRLSQAPVGPSLSPRSCVPTTTLRQRQVQVNRLGCINRQW
jgi:hypothetical protein